MQAPKRKTSKSKRDMRRSHHAISGAMSVNCSTCGGVKLRHQVCPWCGTYRGRKVIEVPAE